MKSSLMGMEIGYLKLQPPQLIFLQNPHEPLNPRFSSIITCSLRGKPKKPLSKSGRLSTEAIQAIQSLKLAKSKSSPTSPTLQHLFNTKLSRLLKADLLDILHLLQFQNELDLTLKVFDFVRKEVWYKPELTLYHAMIQMMGRNKLIEMAEWLFSELEKEGLKPDTRAFSEMIGAYLQVGMIERAMETYGEMKASGCDPDKFTFTILIRNLEEAGEHNLAAAVKKECGDYMDYPEKFLQEVQQKRTKRRVVNLV